MVLLARAYCGGIGVMGIIGGEKGGHSRGGRWRAWGSLEGEGRMRAVGGWTLWGLLEGGGLRRAWGQGGRLEVWGTMECKRVR